MANEAAHVGQYVLVNENERFKDFKSGPPEKKTVRKTDDSFEPMRDGKKNVTEEALVFDKKTGTDFWSAQDENGKVSSFGFKAPSAMCTDGAPNPADPTNQSTTAYAFGHPNETGGWTRTTANGGYINANDIPYVVIPKQGTPSFDAAGEPLRNKYGQIKTSGQAPNAFDDIGLQPGDYVAVTNPKTGETFYAIAAEKGPGREVGEISSKLATLLGIPPKSGNGGWNQMTSSDYLEYKFFPGSGERRGAMIRETDNATIQAKGAAVDEARALGGFVISQGVNSVRIGHGLFAAAFADPSCTHLGGGSILYGSSTVSFENRPASRLGDECTLGMKIVTGDLGVLIFGDPVTGAPGPAPAPGGPRAPVETGFFPETIPGWARAPLGLPANPSLDAIARENSQAQFWKAGRAATPQSTTSATFGTSLLQGAGDSLHGAGQAAPSGLSLQESMGWAPPSTTPW